MQGVLFDDLWLVFGHIGIWDIVRDKELIEVV
jgi:hypothetical protein